MATNNTYSPGNIPKSPDLTSYYKTNRVNLITKKVARELNTYRNWKEFDLQFPEIWDDHGKLSANPDAFQGKGVKSLFSNLAAVYSEGNGASIRDALNMPLLDSPSNRQKIRNKTDCTIKTLVEESQQGKLGRMLYNYSDFMYCKHLGKIPNNYMITLRKFPSPCGDHINFTFPNVEDVTNKHLPDIGRLITWLGTPGNEMSNILSYSYKMDWKENNAPFGEVPEMIGGTAPNEGFEGFLSNFDNRYANEIEKTGGYGYTDSVGDDNWLALALGGKQQSEHGLKRNAFANDANRDVSQYQNTISSVYVPGPRGLSFDQDIKLTFDYELRSYDGINGRSAMLDLLANILMVTYTQGYFFPGSYRSAGMHASNVYANLELFKRPHYTPSSFFADAHKDACTILSSVFGGADGKVTWQSVLETAKGLAGQFFNIFASNKLNQIGRPAKYAATSLITPTPTGQWHLTVGNPRNPILSIGNLIMMDASIEHYGPLGLDDFPTGLKVTVTLKHAKPRDSVAIEQMYMHGDYRIYTPMGEEGLHVMYDIESGEKVKTINTKKSNKDSKSAEYKSSREQAHDAIDADLSHDVDAFNSTIKKITKVPKNAYNAVTKYFATKDFHHATIAAGEAFTGSHNNEYDKGIESDKTKQ